MCQFEEMKINLYINPNQLAAAALAAGRRGRTLSDAMREGVRSRLRAASAAMSALPLPRAEEVASPAVPARVSAEDAWDAAEQPVRIESLASLSEVEHA